MNKSEFVAAIAEEAGLTKKDAEAAVKAFAEVVTAELKKGEKIHIQIKSLLEKGKPLCNDWDDYNKLIEKINNCLTIENNLKNIIEINENIKNFNSKE